MTTSNYSQSHEHYISPEQRALLAGAHRIEVAVKYLNEVAVYADPELWVPAPTKSGGGINLTTAETRTQTPPTSVTGQAGSMLVYGTEQEQRLAEARRQAAEEAQ